MKKPILSDHQKKGKKMIPPLMSFNINESYYVQDSIPEIIWIAIIIEKKGLELGTKLCLDFVESINNCQINKELPFNISWFSSLTENEIKLIVEKLKSNHIFNIMNESLIDLLNTYPLCPLNKIFKSKKYSKSNIDFIKDIINQLFDKKGYLATFSLGNIIYVFVMCEKLKFTKNSSFDHFPRLQEYPNTEFSKMLASSVRATTNIILNKEKLKSEKWIFDFWSKGFEIESCTINL